VRLETKPTKKKPPAWLKKGSLISLVLAAIMMPIYFWYHHGRKVPLRITLNASQYVVSQGQKVALFVDIIPATGEAVSVTFSNPDVKATSALSGTLIAKHPGSHTITAFARRAGAQAKDAIMLQVLEKPLASYGRRTPAQSQRTPDTLPDCPPPKEPSKTKALSAKIIGEPCRGANIVIALDGPKKMTDEIWHRVGDDVSSYRAGRMANIRLAKDATGELTISSMVRQEIQCWRTLQTKVTVKDCDAGPRPDAVFADFTWQLVGPGHFRAAAKLARGKGGQFDRYRWSFGDGKKKNLKTPATAHSCELRPDFHLVTLTVVRGKESATTQRAVFDRTSGQRP